MIPRETKDSLNWEKYHIQFSRKLIRNIKQWPSWPLTCLQELMRQNWWETLSTDCASQQQTVSLLGIFNAASSTFNFSYLISKLVIRIVVFHVNHLRCYPQSVHLIWENVSKALDTWHNSDVDKWEEAKGLHSTWACICVNKIRLVVASVPLLFQFGSQKRF